MERVGIYKFTEHVTELREPIQGRLEVTRDSVIIDADSGPCRYANEVTKPETPIYYECGKVWFSFDRVDPIKKSSFRTTATVTDRTPACTRYTTDKNGNQVCSQTGYETTERTVRPSGLLHLIVIAKPNA